MFTRQRVKPLYMLQMACAEDLDGENYPFGAALERSRCFLPNKVVCMVVRWVVWLRRRFLYFFSFYLGKCAIQLENSYCPLILSWYLI